jgi:asparagine synthase (glutamine-hydrolysing)
MCGLAGMVDGSGRELAEAVVSSAFQALSHRGPDAQKLWHEGPATLLHRRLRILDLSSAADQPMEYRRQRRVIGAYNGEIYNYRALREDLQRQGYSFHTASDTEVLLAGYLAWGNDVFRRARGMWAAALWDPERQSLVLARDPLGKKPLAYASSARHIAFASNVAALLPLLDTMPEIDPDAIDCYLGHLVVPHEHSVFKGITKVPPGSVVEWSLDRSLRATRYWSIPIAPTLGPTREEAAAEVESLLREGVRRRLESDVPLGVFLSSGYDSSLVAAIAAQESGRPLVAVTAGTTGSPDDEREAASAVAARYGLLHRPLEVPAISAANLPMLIAELGEPFGDASILPSFEVARAARREITVALTGDGGDEGFFGYATFRGVDLAQRYRRWIPQRLRRALRSATAGATNDDWIRRAGALFEYGADPLAQGFRNRMGFTAEDRTLLRGPLMNNDGHRAEHIYHERLARLSDLPDSDALRRVFFETYLPNDYLTKVDTATMATSLEARCPFLDVDLVEYVLRLPASVAFPKGQAKALLRPLVRRLLPPEALNRRKLGFGIPIGQWMRVELAGAMEEFVFRPGSMMESLIDGGTARRFYAAHRAGADHSNRLWSLLALGVWCAVVVERRWKATDPMPVSSASTLRR